MKCHKVIMLPGCPANEFGLFDDAVIMHDTYLGVCDSHHIWAVKMKEALREINL